MKFTKYGVNGLPKVYLLIIIHPKKNWKKFGSKIGLQLQINGTQFHQKFLNSPDYKQTQVHCGNKLVWVNCCRPGKNGCPDCLGAGGWWEECPTCGYQLYGDELLKKRKK